MRARKVAAAMSLATVALGAGCGDSFDPESLVKGLRVLAVRATPAEAAPGQQVTIEPLVVDTRGRGVALDWAVCRLGPTPIDPRCVTSDTAPYLDPAGSGTTATITMPPFSQADLVRIDFTGGLYAPVRLRARATGGDSTMGAVTAVYGVRWSVGLPVPPNNNPTIASMAIVKDGQPTVLEEATPQAITAGQEVTLRTTITPESSEEYLAIRGDPRTTPPEQTSERIAVSWLVTAGKPTPDTTGPERPDTEIAFDPDKPVAAGTMIDVWAVARDERGGIGWAHRRLVAR